MIVRASYTIELARFLSLHKHISLLFRTVARVLLRPVRKVAGRRRGVLVDEFKLNRLTALELGLALVWTWNCWQYCKHTPLLIPRLAHDLEVSRSTRRGELKGPIRSFIVLSLSRYNAVSKSARPIGTLCHAIRKKSIERQICSSSREGVN